MGEFFKKNRISSMTLKKDCNARAQRVSRHCCGLMQTGATLLRYATAGHRTKEMLGLVAPKACSISNSPQQEPTSTNIVVVPCKRMQHVGPNNAVCCWPTMPRPFAWALSECQPLALKSFLTLFGVFGGRKVSALNSTLYLSNTYQIW